MADYPNPAAVLDDGSLTLAQKRAVLKNWLSKIESAPDDQTAMARELTIALDAVDQLSAVDTSRGS